MMSSIEVKPLYDVQNWKITDQEYDIHTTAMFMIMPYGDNAFTVAFTDDYAGMGHTWLNPGDSIPEFLECIDFDYTMGKLVGSSDKIRDYPAENLRFMEWLKTHNSVDACAFLIEEAMEWLEENWKSSVKEWIDYCMETDTQPISKAWEWYETVSDSAPCGHIVLQRYTRFWEATWPAFVSAVRQHFDSLKPQPKAMYECRFYINDGWQPAVEATSHKEAAIQTVKNVYANNPNDSEYTEMLEVRLCDPELDQTPVFFIMYSKTVREVKAQTGPLTQEEAEDTFSHTSYFF